jgi:hypothetical protein
MATGTVDMECQMFAAFGWERTIPAKCLNRMRPWGQSMKLAVAPSSGDAIRRWAQENR